jgi:hypothetical protein
MLLRALMPMICSCIRKKTRLASHNRGVIHGEIGREVARFNRFKEDDLTRASI